MRDPAPHAPLPDYPTLDHAAARRIVVGVLLTMMLAALDQVVVATALPTIAASLGDVDNMPWVVTANLLCATAVTPLYGKLSDIHGRRTMLLIAIGIFALGSIACALAPTMLALIGARALQGLGGGGLMPLVQTIIGDVASPRERPRYQAYTSSTFIVSTVGGPLLGGFIAEQLHWSWIFWINVPLAALAFLLTNNVLQRLPRHDRPHQLDLLGAVLMVGGAIALMLALTWGGRRYGWGSPQILALLIGSAALWGLFAWRVIDCDRAVHSALGAARRRHARRHHRGLLRGRHRHRAHHLPAALWPARARPLGERLGADHHRAAGRRHHHVDRRRPADRAHRAATSACRSSAPWWRSRRSCRSRSRRPASRRQSRSP